MNPFDDPVLVHSVLAISPVIALMIYALLTGK